LLAQYIHFSAHEETFIITMFSLFCRKSVQKKFKHNLSNLLIATPSNICYHVQQKLKVTKADGYKKKKLENSKT